MENEEKRQKKPLNSCKCSDFSGLRTEQVIARESLEQNLI
jgi:hypothetical protein